MLNARKLIEKIKEVDDKIGDENKFPYTFVIALCKGKEWERKFWDMLETSTVKKEIKQKLKTWKD